MEIKSFPLVIFMFISFFLNSQSSCCATEVKHSRYMVFPTKNGTRNKCSERLSSSVINRVGDIVYKDRKPMCIVLKSNFEGIVRRDEIVLRKTVSKIGDQICGDRFCTIKIVAYVSIDNKLLSVKNIKVLGKRVLSETPLKTVFGDIGQKVTENKIHLFCYSNIQNVTYSDLISLNYGYLESILTPWFDYTVRKGANFGIMLYHFGVDIVLFIEPKMIGMIKFCIQVSEVVFVWAIKIIVFVGRRVYNYVVYLYGKAMEEENRLPN